MRWMADLCGLAAGLWPKQRREVDDLPMISEFYAYMQLRYCAAFVNVLVVILKPELFYYSFITDKLEQTV